MFSIFFLNRARKSSPNNIDSSGYVLIVSSVKLNGDVKCMCCSTRLPSLPKEYREARPVVRTFIPVYGFLAKERAFDLLPPIARCCFSSFLSFQGKSSAAEVASWCEQG